MLQDETSRLMDFYPRIFLACHTRHVTDKQTGVKLTANQASILDHLDSDEPVTLFDLAMHMGVTPSTMSITVERLVKLAYIARIKDKQDGRKVNLTLTKQGERIKRAKSVLDPQLVQAMLTRLTEAERKLALDGLGLLAYAAEMEMKSRSLGRSWNTKNPK